MTGRPIDAPGAVGAGGARENRVLEGRGATSVPDAAGELARWVAGAWPAGHPASPPVPAPAVLEPDRLLTIIENVPAVVYGYRVDRDGSIHDRFVSHEAASLYGYDIVMDNYATHKTPKIKAWLARRPHYHVHFTPTSASWINQVERWFAELTRKRLQRGVHTSVRQLEADIRAFIDRHNQNPRPFKWTKSADQILASVKRFCHKAQQTLCSEL